jgi:uncharacterized protein (TIGR02118 family)
VIHQFILAAPKPGMETADFQDYWLYVHATRYASRIPQIKQYLVDLRIPFDTYPGQSPLPHQGIAEIWLENEETQLASLQSAEFLDGARRDEPNWAAFWLTIVVDTVAHEIPVTSASRNPMGVKLTTLLKRAPGTSVQDYRRHSMERYAPLVSELPGLRRHLHCHARDGSYAFGEARFDGVEQLWFDDDESLRTALASRHFVERVQPARRALADDGQVFSLAATEHWVIGPSHTP